MTEAGWLTFSPRLPILVKLDFDDHQRWPVTSRSAFMRKFGNRPQMGLLTMLIVAAVGG